MTPEREPDNGLKDKTAHPEEPSEEHGHSEQQLTDADHPKYEAARGNCPVVAAQSTVSGVGIAAQGSPFRRDIVVVSSRLAHFVVLYLGNLVNSTARSLAVTFGIAARSLACTL